MSLTSASIVKGCFGGLLALVCAPSFAPAQVFIGSFVEGQVQYADLNGDGKADLIFQGSDNTFWVSLSDGTGFTYPTVWIDHGGSFVEGQVQYADLNGDGKADLIFEGLDNNFWISLSTGIGFIPPVSTGTGFIPPTNPWDY
jgi:VCBS repeat protein